MLSRMIRFSRKLLLRIPLAAAMRSNRTYRVELDLIHGRHHNRNTHPSILHFSFNKAATQYTKRILGRCAVENGMQPVHIHGYAFDSDFPFLDHLSAEEMKKYQHVFKPQGYLYSNFGGMIEGIPELDKYKVILMTRDPRDILVSQYYSHAYSHPVPDESGDKHASFMDKRRQALGSSIDEYVIAESDALLRVFLRYKNLLLDACPGTCIVSYEQMTGDFRTWLDTLLAGCELKISDKLRNALIVENERLKPREENSMQHGRKGVAGDYLNKLQMETIRFLDEKFEPVLEVFGYK